jgi:hypothetical protein
MPVLGERSGIGFYSERRRSTDEKDGIGQGFTSSNP